jgi:hypothetical protein
MPNNNGVIFARIGWMRYYSGSQSDDERPIGGGSYNTIGRGSEICNFKVIAGKKLYGFFSPPGRDATRRNGITKLERVAPGFKGGELADVTVIFVASNKTTGNSSTRQQRVVGWYQNAKLQRVWQDDPTGERWTVGSTGKKERALYNVVADLKNAVLLPTILREHPIPRGKGGMGQANVRYLCDEDGQVSVLPWMKKAIDYVETYNGENLLTNPLAETMGAAESELEIAAGYESNRLIRKAVEERAMEVTKKYYRRCGYAVEDKSRTESYDFLCGKDGARLRVEVKGTRTDGAIILLTANEVELAQSGRGKTELCVVHSISVSNAKTPKATGGKLVRYENWNPHSHELRPVQYVCQLF